VQAEELAQPIDLEIRLTENGAPTDRAWIVVAPASGQPDEPRKHRAGGTKIGQLGGEQRAVWIAAFNSDPNSEKTYQLTMTLSRRTPTLTRPEPRAAAPHASPFKKR